VGGEASRVAAVAQMRLAVTLFLAVAGLVAAGPAAAAAPIDVSASVEPRSIGFGDTVILRVEATVDPQQIDAAALRLDPALGPWREQSPPETTVSGAHVSWRVAVACLEAACVDALPRASFTVRVPGTAVRISGRWLRVRTVSRLASGATAAAKPPFREQLALPPRSYRIDPGTLALALDAAAASFLAACVALLLRRRRRRADDARSGLERALAAVRQARTRPVEDRRKALGTLARELRIAGLDDAGRHSDRLAWSAGAPDGAALDDMATAVERLVGAAP
jgi:hypothetical protein